MKVRDAKVLEIPNDRTETYLQVVRREICSSLQLVVVIFPTSRDDRYAALKKLCCCENPVPSQVSWEWGWGVGWGWGCGGGGGGCIMEEV